VRAVCVPALAQSHLDVIKTAAHVIDLGPEGGDIAAAGTPEAVAEVKDSYTGQFLKEVLRGQSLIAGK
jgi:excinuclease ABC subunit A